MESISVNPKLKQNQLAKEQRFSSSTLQRYRNVIEMLSPYRFPPNNTDERRQKSSNTNLNDILIREHDLKRLQMTSNDLAKPEAIVKNKSTKTNKKFLKIGSMHENIEINDDYSDEILHNDIT